MSVSKTMFYKKVSHLSCDTLVHPWNENCVCANLDMLYYNIVGTNKFYNLYYLVEYLLKRKRLSKSYLKYLLKGLIQSTVVGVFMGNVFVMSNCIIFKLLGKWHYYTCLVTGTIGGLGILFEIPQRRGAAISTFMNMVLELTVNQLRESRICMKNKNVEVLCFMISSSIFMYFLRTDSSVRKNGGPHIWFYTPPPFPYTTKESESLIDCENQICPHENTCWKDIINAGVRYFGIGTCFHIVSIFLNHGSRMLKSPSFTANNIFKFKNLYTGLFLACYLVTYKTVSCTLCHYQGFDSPLHALPAGFLAGLAYFLQPNISILLTVVSNLLMIGGRHFRDSTNLPNWPYGELVFALSYGLLYHYRINNPQCCPSFFIKMVDACTSGKSSEAYISLRKAISKQS